MYAIRSYYGYAAAFGILIAAMILKRIADHLFKRILLPLAEKSANTYDDLAQAWRPVFRVNFEYSGSEVNLV